MIGIFLCDDDNGVRLRIQAALERKIFIEGWDMAVACSADGPRSLLKAIEGKEPEHGIYFLDVDLKDENWDGFLLGKEIRRLDPHAVLVYITGYGDLAYKTFQYHLEAFDYIVKDQDLLEGAVCRCLEDVWMRLAEEKRVREEIFTLRAGDVLRHIQVKDILFFESASVSHHVLLHTANSWVDFLGSLNELEKQLGERFIRVHRSYLAAADKIDEVDLKRGVLRIRGRECPVSRAGKALIRQKRGGVL